MRYSKYPSYRDSGVEWLGDIPEEWITTKVKYKAPFQVGWTPPTKNEMNFIGDNIWVTIGDLKGIVISKSSNNISDSAVAHASMNITPKGSLLYSFKLSVGTVAFAGRDLYTNEAIASFIENKKTYVPYLYYATPIYIIQNASENIYGAKILNQELIKNANLALPSYQEQQTIANYLDKATAKIDTLIAKQTKLIELLREKRKAVISTAVTRGLDNTVAMKDSGVEWLGEIPEGWESKCMRYAIDLMQTGTTPSTTVSEYYNGDLNWFNPKDLNSQTLTSSSKQVTIKAIKEGACKMFPGNSVLIVGIGATAGKTSYLSEINSSFNQQITGFHSKSNDNKYLFYLMKSFSNTFLAIANYTTLAILNNDLFKAFTIVIPPLREQEQIVNYLDSATSKIDTLMTKSTKAIDLLKEKRTALISAAVTGKIDVREIA